MIFISHRGNISRRTQHLENSIGGINDALGYGFDVEIDTWIIDGRMYLGHDQPKQLVDNENFIYDNEKNLWFHAQTIDTMIALKNSGFSHYFFHKTDDVAITSCGKFWTYIGKPLTENSICCLPEQTTNYERFEWHKCAGVCSDVIESCKKIYEYDTEGKL